MLNVKSLMRSGPQVFTRITNALFNYAPLDSVVQDSDAPNLVMLYMTAHDDPPVQIHADDFGETDYITIDMLDTLAEQIQKVKDVPRLYYTDYMYAWDELPAFVRPQDMIITGDNTAYTAPQFLSRGIPVDDGIFYSTAKIKKEPLTVGVMRDIGKDLATDTLFHVADKVLIFDTTDVDGIEYKEKFIKHEAKMEFLQFQVHNETGMREALNRCDFMLSAQTSGYEYMNLEGAFCGAQPIYPKTDYHTKHVFEDLDAKVRFFDPADEVDSLTAVLEEPSDWTQDDMEALRQRFGATVVVPKIWEEVLDRMTTPKNIIEDDIDDTP